jgi:hypothetical protein
LIVPPQDTRPNPAAILHSGQPTHGFPAQGAAEVTPPPGSGRGALSSERPLYVADCLANKHILLSSEENGESLSSLWLVSPCGRLGPVFQAPLFRLDGILGRRSKHMAQHSDRLSTRLLLASALALILPVATAHAAHFGGGGGGTRGGGGGGGGGMHVGGGGGGMHFGGGRNAIKGLATAPLPLRHSAATLPNTHRSDVAVTWQVYVENRSGSLIAASALQRGTR